MGLAGDYTSVSFAPEEESRAKGCSMPRAVGGRQPRCRGSTRAVLLGAPLIQPLACVAQPALAALACGQDLGQLVAAVLPPRRGLRGVGGDRLFDDRAGNRLVVHRPVATGVGVHLRAVDRDHVPTVARPASAHSASTSPNTSASARS